MASTRERWSPWRHVREHHPDITVHEVELPDGVYGCVDTQRRIIWLDSRLTCAEKRSTLAHELGHLERGWSQCAGDDVEERAVDEWAAVRLVPFVDLQRAIQWSWHLHEVAEELFVDRHMLGARLRAMTDDEQDALMGALADTLRRDRVSA